MMTFVSFHNTRVNSISLRHSQREERQAGHLNHLLVKIDKEVGASDILKNTISCI